MGGMGRFAGGNPRRTAGSCPHRVCGAGTYLLGAVRSFPARIFLILGDLGGLGVCAVLALFLDGKGGRRVVATCVHPRKGVEIDRFDVLGGCMGAWVCRA